MLVPALGASIASFVAMATLASVVPPRGRGMSEWLAPAIPIAPSTEDPGAPSPGSPANEADALVVAAESALASGDVARARKEAAAAVELLRARSLDARDAVWINRIQRAGLVAWRCDDARVAADAWAPVLELRQRDMPADAEVLQQARSNLAAAFLRLSDFAAARTLYEAVLEVRARSLPDDHPRLVETRLHLGRALSRLGETRAARSLEESVLESRLRTLGTDHPETIAARAALALTLKLDGDLSSARALEESVLASRTKTLAPDHEQVLEVRLNLAATLCALGEFDAARAHNTAVLEARLRTLPNDHAEVRIARANLASTMFQMDDLEDARKLQEEVLAACVRSVPPDHPHLSAARANLAATLHAQGDYIWARELQESVLEVYTRTLHPDHPDLHRLRANLATTLESQGDLLGARLLRESALDGLARRLPPEHVDLLQLHLNLAQTMQSQRDWRGAHDVLKSLLEGSLRSLPEDHPTLWRARGMWALTLLSMGDTQGARAAFEGVLAFNHRTLPDGHPKLLKLRARLAWILLTARDYEGSLALREAVFAARSRTLDQDHDEIHDAAHDLAAVLVVQASRARSASAPAHEASQRSPEFTRAIELLDSVSRSRARAADHVRRTAAGREAEARCAELASSLSLTLSVGLGYGGLGPARELWPQCFLHSEATRNAAVSAGTNARRATSDPRYESLRTRLRAASDELARFVQSGSSGGDFLRALTAREQAERDLLALTNVTAARDTGLRHDIDTLSAHLSRGEVILAYRRFTRLDLTWSSSAAGNTQGASNGELLPKYESGERLCAFVVRSRVDAADRSVPTLELVDLGPLAAVEAAVHAWQAAVGIDALRGLASSPEADDSVLRRGSELGRIVLEPLLVELGDVRRIVVVLDDVLHLVPLEALALDPVVPGGPVLLAGDRYRFEVRATLQELIDPPRPTAASNTLVALGGPAFNSEPEALTHAHAEANPDDSPAPSDGAKSRGARFERSFEPLPFTGQEARGVAALYDEVFEGQGTAVVLEKRKASRSALAMLAPSARWLHVATHGWTTAASTLAWDDPSPLPEEEHALARLTSAEALRGMSPMLLCGLALAGSNLPPDALGHPPGLLTAEELASLDLAGCELAVLSACDSARGELRRAGQGVASLQKALQIAGARSVITSLWKVPDEATKDLMLDFYRRVWVERAPKWRALWEAKQRMREAVDERGELRYRVRDWAAWVLTGEPE